MCERFIENFVEKVIEKTKNPLKLYHVSIPDGIEPDDGDFIEFLVAAYSEEEARYTCPGGGRFEDRYGGGSFEDRYDEWITKDKVGELIVIEIGNASASTKPGVIVSSYHAG